MLAIDTNVVVRYLVGDGGGQFTRAVEAVERNDVFIALTVLLETEWVLRDAYDYRRNEVVTALRGLLGLPNVTLAQRPAAELALDAAAKGMDFADALHLAQAQHCDAFVTFDKAFAKAAKESDVGGKVRLA